MTITIENVLFLGSLLLLFSVIAGKTSYRFGVPVLIFFLGIGMLAGSEGVGGIYFNDPKVAQFIGIVSLNFILFSGGLDTNINVVKPVLRQGVLLSTLGVIVTAVAMGFFVQYVTDFSLLESLLLGSIVSSTDAAAVFSVLRSKSLALKSNLRSVLELESGSNDPMAYVLTIAFLGLIVSPEKSLWTLIPLFLQQMVLGAVAGYLFGRLSKLIINKIKLDYEALYPVLVIALMFLTFSATDFVGGNGFLAIYICAVYLGSHNLIHKRTIIKMFEGFAWLMQIVLFLTLGLLVYPSGLIAVAGIGLLISVFLIFIARPLGVFLSLIPIKTKLRNRFFISWVGLRGAVPIVFATYPLLAGIDKANMIFNLVFFISITSVLLQGTTLSLVAKWLHVLLPDKLKPKSPVESFLNEYYPKTAMKEIEISDGCAAVGKPIVELAFPRTANIAMIIRGDNYITPTGNTRLEAGDKLVILSNSQENLQQVEELFSSMK